MTSGLPVFRMWTRRWWTEAADERVLLLALSPIGAKRLNRKWETLWLAQKILT
jgi:hypothetical protein